MTVFDDNVRFKIMILRIFLDFYKLIKSFKITKIAAENHILMLLSRTAMLRTRFKFEPDSEKHP